MRRQLVHDLATNTHEHIYFMPVETGMSSDVQPCPFAVRRPDEYVDHTDASTDYTEMKERLALSLTEIYVRDHSDECDKEPNAFTSVISPCKDVFKFTARHGDFSRHMVRAFTDVMKRSDTVDSLRQLSEANDVLLSCGRSAAMSDSDIIELANEKSALFHRSINRIPTGDFMGRYYKAEELLHSLGLAFSDSLLKKLEKAEIEEVANVAESLVQRAIDPVWLRRQLRRKFAYEVEKVARSLELVERHKQVYCSDFSVTRQRERRSHNNKVLEEMIAVDDSDPENWFTLAELSSKSVSNPEIRRAEMFTRLRGFEELANDAGHTAVFLTVTAPSRFHAVSGSKVNKKWLAADKPDALDAHKYLMGLIDKLGKFLSKNDIRPYGIRVVEPHQDGTPHHHLLLFGEASQIKRLVKEYRKLAFEDSPNERGAKEHRFKVEYINQAKGSAVGYVSKYLSKNIDGAHIEKDRGSALSGIDAAERVLVWARVNRIRQFQFLGGPSVTVWRELRRLREEIKEDDAMFQDLNGVEHFALERVRRAADVGDWKAFCLAMGGVSISRSNRPVHVHYSIPQAVQNLISAKGRTRFGDLAQARIAGLMFEGVFLMTRSKTWTIENKDDFSKRGVRVMGDLSGWFDVLEKEQEYEHMKEEQYRAYEQALHEAEEMEQIYFELSSNSETGFVSYELDDFYQYASVSSGASAAQVRTG